MTTPGDPEDDDLGFGFAAGFVRSITCDDVAAFVPNFCPAIDAAEVPGDDVEEGPPSLAFAACGFTSGC